MPTYCCVRTCRRRALVPDPITGEKVAFHRIPSDPKRRRLWLKVIPLHSSRDLTFAKICSKHFLKDDYLKGIASGKKMLRDNVVPSVFEGIPSPQLPSHVATSQEDDSSNLATSNPSEPTADPTAATRVDEPDADPTAATGADEPITDLNSYANDFLCMLRKSGTPRSRHLRCEAPKVDDRPSELPNVVATDSGNRCDEGEPNEDRPFEDLHTYSEKLISMLRDAAATAPQCGGLTDDDESLPDPDQGSDSCGDAGPTHRDAATSPHQCYRDAATSPHRYHEDLTNVEVASPLRTASSVNSKSELHKNKGKARQFETIQQELQYTKHKVAWLRSALAKRNKRIQELQQECSGLRTEAVALRQRAWLSEARERHRNMEHARGAV